MFTRIDVRDGKIAAVGYHSPFDLLFSSSEFEYGDLVEKRKSYSNPAELRERLRGLIQQ